MTILRVASFALLLLITNVAFGADGPAPSIAVDPQKVAAINEMLEVTGGMNLANQMVAQMLESQKKAHPEVDAAVWDRLAKKLDINDLRGTLVELYDHHFSTADLQALVAFYKSPPGQRMLKEMPSLMSESMILGREWGRKKTQELKDELQYDQDHQTKRG